MFESTPNRRHVLATGLAGSLCGLTGFGAGSAALAVPTFSRPFSGSRTVSSFASGLFFCDDAIPIALRSAIEAKLSRIDIPPDSETEERRRAGFFAGLTVSVIAPAYLRRAGYEQMAADVANGSFPPAAAQHTIGKQYVGAHPIPRLASFAYGASAHASTAAFYAGHEDINVVIETGHYCARALLEGFSYDDAAAADATAIWDFAVRAINTALETDSEETARHGLNLNTPA